MTPRIRFTCIALLAGVALSSADAARAAVLLPDLEAVLANDDSHDQAAGARSTAPLVPTDAPDHSPNWIEQALVALPSSPASMAGNSTSVAGSAPASATLAAVVRVDGALLVDYLSRETRLRLPVPFLSGVFRPPRKADRLV